MRHTVFLVGTQTEADDKYITVQFADKSSKFVYPGEFEMFIQTERLEEEDIKIIKQIIKSKQKYDERVDTNIKKLEKKQEGKCLDPDKSSQYKCVVDGHTITLAQDGLCSLKIIEKYSDNIASDYELIRKDMFDCLVWPRHQMSINQMRYTKYRDRMDLLLIDIEKFYRIISSKKNITYDDVQEEINAKCGLGRTFLFPNTFFWLCSFGSFNGFIERRRFQAFVDEQNGQFKAVKWTDTDKFEDYYVVLINKVKKYKELCK